MDWKQVYDNIILNARDREIDPELRYEQHHIIPRSLGGSDDPGNLVKLTPREHFLCHAMLIKITEGADRHKMLYAFNAMRMSNEYQDRVTSRMYDLFKAELYEVYSQKMLSENPMHNPEHRATHAEAMKTRKMVGMTGRKHTPETIAKMKAARAKQVITEETKQKLSEHRKLESQDPNYFNGCFIGWYVTPWGRFKGYDAAADGQPVSAASVRNWCRINNTKKLSKRSAGRCAIFSKDDVGKTFAELGFGFEEA